MRAYIFLKRYKEALKASEKYLKLCEKKSGETDVSVIYFYILLLELNGKRDKAIEYLEDYCEKFPGCDTGPPLHLPLKNLLESLRKVKDKKLYSIWTMSFKLYLDFQDEPSDEVIRFLKEHLEIFPEGKKYIKMLEKKKSVRVVISEISLELLDKASDCWEKFHNQNK